MVDSENLVPARNISPARILHREMMARGLTAASMSDSMSTLTYEFIREFLKGEMPIDQQLALIFSEYFGTSIEFWLNLQRNYDTRREQELHAKKNRTITNSV